MTRIWHQSFTVLEDVPHYRDALARHLSTQAGPDTTVELHGMAHGTYPSDYPGTHIGYVYLAGLHKEQFVQAALRAQDEGYDAFFIATIPDTAYAEIKTLIDIPVITVGHTSLTAAAALGDRCGIVNFIAALEPQLRANAAAYRLEGLLGPIVQVEAEFHDVMAAYADPGGLIDAFGRAARSAIAAGANVIIPGEGPLNVFLADQGISRIDEVPVLDSLGTCVKTAQLRAAQYAATGLRPHRVGFFGAAPPRDLVDAARDFYSDRDSLR